MFGTIGILQDNFVSEQSENNEGGPLVMNAFEMITLSQGLNLSALFDRGQVGLSFQNCCDLISQIEVFEYFSYSTIPRFHSVFVVSIWPFYSFALSCVVTKHSLKNELCGRLLLD